MCIPTSHALVIGALSPALLDSGGQFNSPLFYFVFSFCLLLIFLAALFSGLELKQLVDGLKISNDFDVEVIFQARII